MVRLIEKKPPPQTGVTYTIELEEEELRTLWGAISSSVFQCEKTLQDTNLVKSGMLSTKNMKERIDYEKGLSHALHTILFG